MLSLKSPAPIELEAIEIKPIFRRALKGFAVTLILLECIWPVLNRFQSDFDKEIIHQQTFSIIQTEHYPKEITPRDYQQLHFHPNGFLILETSNGQFYPHEVRISQGANQFQFANGTRIKVLRHGDDWLFTNEGHLLWRCRRVANEKLPLLQDNFHWTVESMIPE